MGLPKKALRESQLKRLTAGSAVEDGSHQIFRVTFIEGGTEKSAFFKKLEPKKHYPELLAKISVAVSALKRIFQGKYSAEERLVFDDEDQIVGTLSIAVPGFKPLNFSYEAIPADLSEKEQVIPSAKTLIAKNMMEVLFGRWFLYDDDGHPHNLGFAGDHAADIDFDMFIYWFTIYMKEPRPIIGVPNEHVELTVHDWETFPHTRDAKPYHGATYDHPGQESLPSVLPAQSSILPKVLPKSFAAPTQFQLLARDPKAQEQKLAAALKALLTYDPDMVRARLEELFGDISLNYTSLDETDAALRVKYESKFPLLCNDKTNVKPFVDFMMKIYQKHYDSLYRVVVFYMGCKNNGHGVELPAMSSALFYNPSFFQNVETWVTEQNKTLLSKEDDGVKYDLTKLKQRYHQVWRDAFAPNLKELLHNSFKLTNDLVTKLSSSLTSSFVVVSDIVDKEPTDINLTTAWQFFGILPDLPKEKIAAGISVDKDSKLRAALLLLVDFTNEFHALAEAYYKKDCTSLTEEDNLTFVRKIKALLEKYNVDIRENFDKHAKSKTDDSLTISSGLGYTSTYATAFNSIAIKLNQFAEQANFKLHLTTTDEQMKEVAATVATKELPHTHKEVIDKYKKAIFLWAKSLPAEELSSLINEVIDTHYAPLIGAVSRRQRAAPVKAYLAASMHESGENRLAYILSAGTDTGALNTFLIQYLTPKVLLTQHVPSIGTAVKSGAFLTDIAVFTHAAVEFAKNDEHFTHLQSAAGIKLFYRTLFDWMGSLEKSKFNGLIGSALTDYESKINTWFTTSRRAKVEDYCRTEGPIKALGMIFVEGGITTTSLNRVLFSKIIAEIKKEIGKNPAMLKAPGFRLIAQYDPEMHQALYLDQMVAQSTGFTHVREVREHLVSAVAAL